MAVHAQKTAERASSSTSRAWSRVRTRRCSSVGLRRERDDTYDIVAKIQAGDTEAAIAAISSLDSSTR